MRSKRDDSAGVHLRSPGSQGARPRRAARAGQRDTRLPHRGGIPQRRASRAQPRGGRADHRAAPRLRLPGRPDRLRHRPPGLRAQAAHRAAGWLRPAEAARRRVRVPEPGRVRARHRGELARLHRPVLCRRAGQGVPAAGRARPHGGRRGRRRRADRRHGLGGAQQHRRGEEQPAGHRGQRQRPLLHADDRRARRAPGRGAGVAAVRARAGVHQDLPAARPAARPAPVRDAARDQEGPQGRAAAAGALRGPRHQVPGPGGRP